MSIKIDKGVPIPSRVATLKAIYPWSTMDVGDSFYVEDASVGNRTSDVGSRIGRKFISRKEGDGVRIWRTA
tara:strand:- start:287 stop:499 length:213 start_codon:yes stop_codon:yes gene_type:complete